MSVLAILMPKMVQVFVRHVNQRSIQALVHLVALLAFPGKRWTKRVSNVFLAARDFSGSTMRPLVYDANPEKLHLTNGLLYVTNALPGKFQTLKGRFVYLALLIPFPSAEKILALHVK